MLRVFWIGSPFFQASLARYGVDVHYFNFENVAIFGWDDIVSMLGYVPDVVVVADKSRAPFVLGVEKFPCLTVFYAVDTHIHSWYDLYAQAFDLCLVSLHDHLEFFKHKYLSAERIVWFPPFAKDTDIIKKHVEPEWNCLFVGSVHVQNLPKRQKFFEELSVLLPDLHTARGNYVELFPKGRVLLNQCEGEDLNFRVFEALGCAGCLVTPHIGHGLSSLFVDGQDLVTYEPHDAADAARKIKTLLNDSALRKTIARQGFAKVDAKHRAKHRAKAFVDLLHSLENWNETISKRLKNATMLRKQYLRQMYLLFAEALQDNNLRKAYLQAAKD